MPGIANQAVQPSDDRQVYWSIMSKKEPRGIQSIEVSGRILDALLAAHSPVMLKDIAAFADIPPAQVHAYLTSLKRMDMVVQDAFDGRYSLGPLALRLGLAYREAYAPVRRASEALAEIEEKTGLMCALVIWSNAKPVVFEVRTGRKALNVNLKPGMVFPMVGSPVGAIFAAFLPEAQATAALAEQGGDTNGQHPAKTIEPIEFDKMRENARNKGCIALAGQPIVGVNSLALPVFEGEGSLLGAFLLIGNSMDLNVERTVGICEEVRRAMKEPVEGPAT